MIAAIRPPAHDLAVLIAGPGIGPGASGLICDQTIRLAGVNSTTDYPDHLRRIKYRDATQDKTLVFLTNNFMLPALTIAELYRSRWQVELFF